MTKRSYNMKQGSTLKPFLKKKTVLSSKNLFSGVIKH